jgi:hypothetical protein
MFVRNSFRIKFCFDDRFQVGIAAAALIAVCYGRILILFIPMMPMLFLAHIGALLLVVAAEYDVEDPPIRYKVARKMTMQYAARILLLFAFIIHVPLEASFRFVSLVSIFFAVI